MDIFPNLRDFRKCGSTYANHMELLQSYVWQDFDLAPCFPRLSEFLDFWNANLEGPLYRVRVAHKALISPAEFSFVEGELQVH